VVSVAAAWENVADDKTKAILRGGFFRFRLPPAKAVDWEINAFHKLGSGNNRCSQDGYTRLFLYIRI
jgi:hypothetical protein